EAKALRDETKSALQEGQSFLDTNDLNSALASGKSLLAARQGILDKIASRTQRASLLTASGFVGAAAALNDSEEARADSSDLAEINRQLALNAQRIEQVTAAQAARRAE